MKLILYLLCVFISPVLCFAQKSVSDLQPKHAIVLEEFLSKNKNYGFLSEKAFDVETLKYLRKDFGAKITPYYKVGDFNNDKIVDFALVLSRKGTITENEGSDEPYKYNQPLAIVIFNGTNKGDFKKAFIEDIAVPLICFFNLDSRDKKRPLYFGVYASDADTMIFTPVGKGYIIEYPDEP